MAAQVVDRLSDSQNDGGLQILPEGGHEVPAILLLTINGQNHAIGNVKEDLSHPPNVMVRLGTRVNDRHPSSVGFRVLLRTDKPRFEYSGSIDDLYHTVSCKFDPQGGNLTYAKAIAETKKELTKTRHFRAEELGAGTDQDLYQINFYTSDTNAFIITRHGPTLQSTDGHLRKIERLVSFIAYASQLSLFFIADKLLAKYLAKAVKQGCVGDVAPAWQTGLADDAVTTWPANVQTQMVAGSVDVLNVALIASHEQPLRDGPGTSVRDRSEAVKFKEFVRKTYPNTREEPGSKVYPIMLNVPDGRCNELPFGASMVNRINSYSAINSLHGLLASQIPASHIGIVALYPGQAEIYKDALERCHKYSPESGYNHVQCDTLENWVHKTVAIAIVDLVRTANASGNLGYLSQANRLKALLSLHQDGLIIVGDRGCTITSQGTITSAKLDKILQWFVDHGRIVQVSKTGLPLLTAPPSITPATISIPLEKASSTGSNPSHPPTLSVSSSSTEQPSRRYVGIPGLEHLRLNKPINEDAGIQTGRSAGIKHWVAAQVPVKQGFATNLLPRFSSKAPIGDAPSTASTAKDYLHDDQPEPDVYTSFATKGTVPSSSTKSTAKGLARSFKDGASVEEKKTVDKPRNIGTEMSISKTKENSTAAKAPTKEANRPDAPPVKSKGNGVPPSPTGSSLHQGSVAPFENLTNRPMKESATETSPKPHKEISSKTSLTKSNSTLLTPAMYLANPLSLSSGDLRPVESTGKEDTQPYLVTKAASSQVPKIKTENVSPKKTHLKLPPHKAVAKPLAQNASMTTDNKATSAKTPQVKNENEFSEKDDTKRPPHKALPQSSTQDLPMTAPKGQTVFKPSLPSPAFQFSATGGHSPVKFSFSTPTLQNQAIPSLFEQIPRKIVQSPAITSVNDRPPSQAQAIGPHAVTQTASASTFNTAKPAQQLDFKARYQPKYKTLRTRFAELDPKINRVQPQEDQLFRRLAEAVVDEDAGAFDRTYTELLGMFTKLQTSVLRRT